MPERRLVTQREFAQIIGLSAMAVSKAIAQGRLKRSLFFDGKAKKPSIDVDMAIVEWKENSLKDQINLQKPAANPEMVPYVKPDEPANPVQSYNQSRAINEAYKARMSKIEYEERIGKLVDAEKIRDEAFKMARTVRDSMLNIPDRVSAEFAGINNAHAIHTRLTEEIKKALEGLVSK